MNYRLNIGKTSIEHRFKVLVKHRLVPICFYMRYGKNVNVLCIVDQNHERSAVVLEHFKNFKGI